jgi:hypothetical protein
MRRTIDSLLAEVASLLNAIEKNLEVFGRAVHGIFQSGSLPRKSDEKRCAKAL